ncbi:ATP-dependent RNA helicase DDX24 [Plecturocebus cupreus]
MIKLKKNKGVEIEGMSIQKESEVKDAEPKPQGDGTICPDPEEERWHQKAWSRLFQKRRKGKKKLSLPMALSQRCLKKQRHQCLTRRTFYAQAILQAVVTLSTTWGTQNRSELRLDSLSEAGIESGVLPDETGIESEMLPSEAELRLGCHPTRPERRPELPPQTRCCSSVMMMPLSRRSLSPDQMRTKRKGLKKSKLECQNKSWVAKCYLSNNPLMLQPNLWELKLLFSSVEYSCTNSRGCSVVSLILSSWLWELVKENHLYLSTLQQFRCLLVDGADWMIEKGCFAELSQLLEMLSDSQYNPERQTLGFFFFCRSDAEAKKMNKTAQLDLLMQKIGMRGKSQVIDPHNE